MKKLLTIAILAMSVTTFAQQTPTNKTRSDNSFTQVDNYLVGLKRLGVPTSSTDNLDAAGLPQNTVKIIYNTTLKKLRIYDPTADTWKDASPADLSLYYKKTQVDSLLAIINTELLNYITKGTAQTITADKTIAEANLILAQSVLTVDLDEGFGTYRTQVSGDLINMTRNGTAQIAAMTPDHGIYLKTRVGATGTGANIRSDLVTANRDIQFQNKDYTVAGLDDLATGKTIGANTTGNAATATTAGSVTTAAQPSITSVGTLMGLNVSGAGSVSGKLTAPNLLYNTYYDDSTGDSIKIFFDTNEGVLNIVGKTEPTNGTLRVGNAILTNIITATGGSFNNLAVSNAPTELADVVRLADLGVYAPLSAPTFTGTMNADNIISSGVIAAGGALYGTDIQASSGNSSLGNISLGTGKYITLNSSPTSAPHAANKGYVDWAMSPTETGVITVTPINSSRAFFSSNSTGKSWTFASPSTYKGMEVKILVLGADLTLATSGGAFTKPGTNGSFAVTDLVLAQGDIVGFISNGTAWICTTNSL